jgi:hypothetical protein
VPVAFRATTVVGRCLRAGRDQRIVRRVADATRCVVISLAPAGRAASTVQCCSAPRLEACICKIGSGPLRERAASLRRC